MACRIYLTNGSVREIQEGDQLDGSWTDISYCVKSKQVIVHNNMRNNNGFQINTYEFIKNVDRVVRDRLES